ncbi:MAG: transglycosylase domain-containing protein [Peptoniphilaceae bacterium]|nr:transglycosylase domain-containing protein [Peptoniphilaceae bacterium]
MVKRFITSVLKVLAILILCFLIFLAIISGYLAGAMLEIAKESPQIEPDRLLSDLKENSVIVDKDGHLIESIDTAEYRKIIPYDKIPPYLVNAFISAEDKRFLEHDGVDLIGIAATVRDFLLSGNLRGASTITMQLARNVYLNNDVNWTRKIQEIFLALQIDDQLSKEEIMESYLNRIFFGQNAYGVEAAAQIYFSKSASDLSLAQAAAIASIVPAPSHYSLYSTIRPSQVTDQRVLDETTINGEKYAAVYNPPAYERAHWVLGEMLENQMISQVEYNEAIAEDVASAIDAPQKRAENVSTYLTDLMKDQIVQVLMDSENIDRAAAKDLMMYGGLTITSTVDMNLQRKLQDYAASVERSFTTPSGETTPFKLDINYDDYDNIVNRGGNILFYKKSNLLDEKGQVLIPEEQYSIDDQGNLSFTRGRLRGHDGYIDIMDYYTFDDNDILYTHHLGTIPIDKGLTVDKDGTMHLTKEYLDSNQTPLYAIRDDGVLVLSPSYYDNDEIGVKQPQLAFTVLDSKTGEVRAIIGGREQDERHFLNRAAKFPRQPGSAFKPIAEYTAAIGAGNNAGVGKDDAPVQMIDNEPWPSNVDGTYQGMMSMQQAVVDSSNPIAVRWLDEVGIDVTKEYLQKNGIINAKHPDWDHFVERKEDPKTNDENLALALGAMTDGVTTLEMAGAYQSIANDGKHIAPMSILKIVDNRGKVYYENKHEETEVLKPELNYQLLDILRHVVTDSFASKELDLGEMNLIGKTGTTNNRADFWFAGSTPYYTTAVWTGADNAQIAMDGNSTVAAALFAEINGILNEDLEPREFERPDGVFDAEVSNLSGQKPTDATWAADGVIKIPVSEETAPKKDDDVYVWARVDVRNNLLAGRKTPKFLTKSRVFIERPSDYKPREFGGIYPKDWWNNVPTEYSDLGWIAPASDSSEAQTPNGKSVEPELSALEALLDILPKQNTAQ